MDRNEVKKELRDKPDLWEWVALGFSVLALVLAISAQTTAGSALDKANQAMDKAFQEGNVNSQQNQDLQLLKGAVKIQSDK